MNINVIYDQSQSSLPAGFVAAVNYVVNFYDTTFTNAVTVNIDLGYGEIAGQSLGAGALGESETYFDSFDYSTAVNALTGNEPSNTQKAAYSTLPGSSPLSGGTLWMSTAEEKALGLLDANDSAIDGYVGLSNSYPFSYPPGVTPAFGAYYFVGVLAHEFSEVMGRDSMLGEGLGGTNSYTIMDLFRYSAAGARQLSTGGPAYFSIDNGNTNLNSWNTDPNGDLGDWAASAGADAYLAFSPSGQVSSVSATDIELMNVLGWDTTPPASIVVSGTSAEALQGGSAVTLLSAQASITDGSSSTISSATIRIANGGGSAVAGDKLFINGQQSGSVAGVAVSWNSSTATLTLTGTASLATYQTLLGEVTYQDTGTDASSGSHPQRTVTWTVNDGSQNLATTSQVTIDRAPVARNDAGLDVIGTPLAVAAASGVLANDSDLDGDTLRVTAVAGQAGNVGVSIAGSYGHLTLNADGSYSYVANNGASAGSVDSFSYAVADGNGGSATATLKITLDNPLQALPLAVLTPAGQATPSTWTLAPSGGDGALTYTLASAAAHGTATVNANGTFSYTPTAGYSGSDSFQFKVTDALGLSSVNTVSVGVGYPWHSVALTLDNGLAVNNGSSDRISGATVKITGGFAADGDVLSANTSGTAITASWNSATETLTLTGTDSAANYRAVLDNVMFGSSLTDPTNAGADPTRTVTWQVTDATNSTLSAAQSETIDLSLPPTEILVSQTSSEALQGGAALALLASANIADGARTTVSSATIRIANGGGNAVAGDQLFVNGQQSATVAGVTVSWNAGTATLTLTGTASLATYQTLLDEVTYQETGTDASSGSHPQRTVTWTVNDGTKNLVTTSQVTIDRAPAANNDTAADVVGTALSVSAASGVLANDTDLDADALSVASVSDTSSTGVVGQPIAGLYGHLTLNADGSYTYTADISSAINSAATGSHLHDVFTYTAADGNGGNSNAATLNITLDRLPVVTASNVALPPSTIVAVSSLFSPNDPDGDPITQYSFYDSSITASSGQFLLNGAAQPKGTNQPLVVSAAQLSRVTFQSGTNAGDDLFITAYAGSVASNVGQLVASVTPPPPPAGSAPAITFNDQTVAPSQSVPLTSIFSVSGSGITEYQVWFSHPEGGNPALGMVTNNGIPIALDQPVTVASLSGLNYIGSSTSGTDIVFLRAYDGTWSGWTWAGLTDQGITPPAITPNNQTVANDQSVALSNIFSLSSANPITQYQVWFSHPEGGNPALGTVTNNGIPIPLDQPVTISSLSGLTYTGSATPGMDILFLRAYDGAWSGWNWAGLTDQGVLPAVITPINQTVANNQSVAVSNLFSLSSSSPITQYQVWFSHPEGGNPALGTVTNNGVPIPLDQPVTVSSLSGLTYTGSATPGTDILFLRAYDGTWSGWNWAGLTDPGVQPAVITPINQTVADNQSVPVSSIFSVSGGPITQYQVWFSHPEGGNPALGTVTDNGTAIPLDQPVTVSNLSGLTYTGSATTGTDILFLRAFDGVWSGWNWAGLTDTGTSSSQSGSLADGAPGSVNHTVLLLDQYMAAGFGDSDFGPTNPVANPTGASQDQSNFLAPTPLASSHPT